MNKIIKVSFDGEKLYALRKYAKQRGISVEAELAQAAENLYQKIVPVPVKSYLEMKASDEEARTQDRSDPSSAVESGSGGGQP